METEKCPYCGSRSIGKGIFSGYATLGVKGKAFASSTVEADVCSECGYILALRATKPEKFLPKDE